MKYLTQQSILIVGWAVVGSQLVTHIVVKALAPEYLSVATQLSPLVSTLVALPITIAFSYQAAKLAKANEKLSIANKALGIETEIARRDAMLDPMTNTLNRTHFIREIEENRTTEFKDSFFLMLDADNFKTINDTFGHAAGDKALISITETIRDTIREEDIVGRLGGEEFGIYLRNVSRKMAEEIAERIRERVECSPIKVGGHQPHKITVSIGAVFAAKEHDITELMHQADRNLYRAKGNGRNRVVFDAFKRKRDGVYTTACGPAAVI